MIDNELFRRVRLMMRHKALSDFQAEMIMLVEKYGYDGAIDYLKVQIQCICDMKTI